MKICIVEPDPSFGGGSERICFDLAHGLSEIDQLYLVYQQAGSMLPAYQECCEDVHQMKLAAFGWKSLPRTLKSAVVLRKQLNNWGIDAIICSNVHLMRTLALATVATKVRVLYHLGLPMSHPKWSKRVAFRRFHMGIAPSDPTMRTWLDAGWPAQRLCVVPNWVDARRFAPASDRNALRRQLDLPVERTLICYVGRLEKEKGIQTLLMAFEKLLRSNKALHLVLVGESQDQGVIHWQSLARELGLTEQQVRFTGRTATPELYFAASDVAVVPSEWEEPFGLTALEAMATCTPPVVTDVGILRSIVGDAARLLCCEKANVDSLLRAIERVLTLSTVEREKLGRELRARVLSHFSSAAGVQAYRAQLQ